MILVEHEKWNIAHGFKHTPCLPYLYANPKMHKNPPSLRYIAGIASIQYEGIHQSSSTTVSEIFSRPLHQARSSTTEASICLSKQLQVVMDLLQKKDEERYKVTGVRRCWFIRSIEEVFLEVKKEKDMLKVR